LEAPEIGTMAEQVSNGTADRAGEPIRDTDEQLILAFTRGSTEAFTALFLRYKQPLYGFFRRRVGVGSLAEELTQETFIALLRSIDRYHMTALFRTYLYAVAYRVFRSHRRKAFFRAGFSASETPSHEPAASPSIETDLLMREALRKLDRVEREIILLREFEQLSYLEIATLLHIPVNTVRSRLFRARSTLRVLLMGSPARTRATNLSMTKEQA
jgi:RNA polymerase sigma-70 factor (ECF subfamily)